MNNKIVKASSRHSTHSTSCTLHYGNILSCYKDKEGKKSQNGHCHLKITET